MTRDEKRWHYWCSQAGTQEMQHVSEADKADARLLLKHWSQNLFDDGAFKESGFNERFEILTQSESNRFYYIKTADAKELVGVVYLTDFTQSEESGLVATINAAVKRKFWGAGVRENGRFLVEELLYNTELNSIRAEVFRDNVLPKRALRLMGLKRDEVQRLKTVLNGELTEVEIWTISRRGN